MPKYLPIPEPGISQQKKMIQDRAAKASGGDSGGGGRSILDALSSAMTATPLLMEQQANAQKQQAIASGALKPPTNPIDQMMQDFQRQYQSINVQPTSLEQLQRMAEQQVGAQFDPMLQMLTSQMGAKQKRAGESQGKAREMYGALSKDFLSQLPQLTQQFAAEDQETNKRYDTVQQQLQQQYQGQQQQQNALLQQLGIQAAAPDASQRSMEDQSYFQGQMETDQQSALNALNQQQQAAKLYQQQLGDTTRVAGENTAQDIGSMLEDYLQQAEQQKMGLQQQRGSAYSTLLQQMQTQAQDRASKEEQQQFENLLNMSKFQLSAAEAAQKASGSPLDALFKGTTGRTGGENFLATKYPNEPVKASGIMELVNKALSNPDVVRGKFELQPGDKALGKGPVYADVGQQMIEDILRKEAEKANQVTPGRYGTPDITSAIDALAAIMGKLR